MSEILVANTFHPKIFSLITISVYLRAILKYKTFYNYKTPYIVFILTLNTNLLHIKLKILQRICA